MNIEIPVSVENIAGAGGDRRTWTHKQTIDFINLAKDRELITDTDSKTCRNTNAFKAIKEDMDNLGYDFTTYELRRKWKTMKQRYYRILSHTSKSVNWRYFDAMHEILEDSPNSLKLQSRFGHVSHVMEPDVIVPGTSEDMSVEADQIIKETNHFLPLPKDNVPAHDSTDTESDTSMDDTVVSSQPKSGISEQLLRTRNAALLYQAYARNMAAFMSGSGEKPANALEVPSLKDDNCQSNEARIKNALLQSLQSRFGFVTTSNASAQVEPDNDSIIDEGNISSTSKDNGTADNSVQETPAPESDTSGEDRSSAISSFASSGSSGKVSPAQKAPSPCRANDQNVSSSASISESDAETSQVFEKPYPKDENESDDAKNMNTLLQMEMVKMLKEVTQKPNKEPDRFDYFGTFIACHLRSMTQEKSNTAMKHLSRTLFEND